MTRLLRGAVTLAACFIGLNSAGAQANPRISFGGDSLAQLTAGLSPAARQALDAYLSAPNNAAARRAITPLRTDPTAADFLIAALPKEPSDSLRVTIITAVRAGDYLWTRPQLIPALRDRVRNDPSLYVVRTAIDYLRMVVIRASGLRTALGERIIEARAANDSALLRIALDEDESAGHAEANIYSPLFLRPAPPPFVAAPAGRAIRVLAFGDYGTAHLVAAQGNSHQVKTAAGMLMYHRQHPFTFGLTAGDNFYPTSFANVNDPAWKISWDDLYTPLKIPFYISLGNHDWGQPAGPLAEYVYGRTSPSWKFPAEYYTYTAGPTQFFAINTNLLSERQLAWLRDELAKSTAKWKVVYGHFPVYEQTNYTVAPQQKLLLPILKEFKVDMYICGHHHTMQHWQVDGINYVVSGAGGATNYSLGDTTKAAPDRKYMASRPGFAVLDMKQDAFTLRFVGPDAKVLYEYTGKK